MCGGLGKPLHIMKFDMFYYVRLVEKTFAHLKVKTTTFKDSVTSQMRG